MLVNISPFFHIHEKTILGKTQTRNTFEDTKTMFNMRQIEIMFNTLNNLV